MKSVSKSEVYSCLLFILGGRRFAVELRYVERIEPYQVATALPFTPSYYQGVVNLQGQALPQVCLADYFSLANSKAKNSLKIFLEQRSLSMAVDEVEQQIVVEKTSLKQGSNELLLGEFEYQSQQVFLLNCEALLDLLAVKKRNVQATYHPIQQQKLQNQAEKLEDYILIQQGDRHSAIRLVELEKIIELEHFVELSTAEGNVFGLTVVDGQTYFLCKNPKQSIKQEKQLAIIPFWGKGRFALLIDETTSLSITPSQVCKQGSGQSFIQHKKNWYQVDHVLQQEIESYYQLLSDSIPNQDKVQVIDPIETIELLLFQQAGKVYGVKLAHIYRVIGRQQQTVLPEHDTLKAVIALDNEVVPVCKPLAEFSLKGTEYIVFYARQGLFAIVAEKLLGTFKVAESEFKKNHGLQLIDGWVLHHDSIITVLNPLNFSN